MTRKKTAEPRNTCRLTLNITPELYAQMNALSKATGIGKATILRNALIVRLEQMAKEAAK